MGARSSWHRRGLKASSPCRAVGCADFRGPIACNSAADRQPVVSPRGPHAAWATARRSAKRRSPGIEASVPISLPRRPVRRIAGSNCPRPLDRSRRPRRALPRSGRNATETSAPLRRASGHPTISCSARGHRTRQAARSSSRSARACRRCPGLSSWSGAGRDPADPWSDRRRSPPVRFRRSASRPDAPGRCGGRRR